MRAQRPDSFMPCSESEQGFVLVMTRHFEHWPWLSILMATTSDRVQFLGNRRRPRNLALNLGRGDYSQCREPLFAVHSSRFENAQ